jgi:hypothetical protein
MRLEKRVERIEYDALRRDCEQAAAGTSVTAEALWSEFQRVFRLSDAEQRDYYANVYAELDATDAAEFDAIRHRCTTIVRRS